MARAGAEKLSGGVYTASAGNMAQGVAWNARRLGVPCTVIVPEHAPQSKLAAIERLGGRIVKVPFERWWQVLVDHHYPGIEGLFIHPVADPAVIAGNGTIGLEILEDLPDADTVLVPFGGGGLSCGIACAVRSLRPSARVFACEVETAAPLSASLAAGRPVAVDYEPSFVDGIGGRSVLPEMWPLASSVLSGSIVVSLAEIAAAIAVLAGSFAARSSASSQAATSTRRSFPSSSEAGCRSPAQGSPHRNRQPPENTSMFRPRFGLAMPALETCARRTSSVQPPVSDVARRTPIDPCRRKLKLWSISASSVRLVQPSPAPRET
jgi:threonine dehydratase